jgi:hypothetical protein
MEHRGRARPENMFGAGLRRHARSGSTSTDRHESLAGRGWRGQLL